MKNKIKIALIISVLFIYIIGIVWSYDWISENRNLFKGRMGQSFVGASVVLAFLSFFIVLNICDEIKNI